MSFKIHAWPGKIIVQSDEFKYTGRIVIPDKTQRRPTTGTVVAVGRGVGYYEEKIVEDPNDSTKWESTQEYVPYCKVGDRLVYGIYSGVVLNIKGAPMFVVLTQDEILATVTGEAELEAVGAS